VRRYVVADMLGRLGFLAHLHKGHEPTIPPQFTRATL